MSQPDASNYRHYYREIELHWSISRGNQVIVSPLEFDSITQWWQKKIPLPVVLRSIDRFIERKKKNPRKRQYLLNHLEGDVEKLYKEYQLLHQGAFTPDTPDSNEKSGEELIETKIKSLARKFKKLRLPYLDWVQGDLLALAQPQKCSTLVSFNELESLLVMLEERIFTQLNKHEDADVLADLKNELLEFLDPEKDGAFIEKAYNDQLRMHFGIPRLTVLG